MTNEKFYEMWKNEVLVKTSDWKDELIKEASFNSQDTIVIIDTTNDNVVYDSRNNQP